jgi:hypothetical protein
MRRDRRIQLVGDGFADEELSVGIFLRPMTFHQLRGQASGSLVLRAAAVAWESKQGASRVRQADPRGHRTR